MAIKKLTRAFVALVAFVAAAVWVAPAPALAAGNPYVMMAYLDVNKCIDDPNSSQTQGLQMTIYYCNGGLNQDWWFIPSVNYGGDLWLENGASNQCLTVYGAKTVPNTPVIQWGCTDGNNEVWRQVATGVNDTWGRDYYTIRPLNALNQCLTLFGASTNNGTKLITYTCNGGSNQWWTWV
jgi:hypothetical protein